MRTAESEKATESASMPQTLCSVFCLAEFYQISLMKVRLSDSSALLSFLYRGKCQWTQQVACLTHQCSYVYYFLIQSFKKMLNGTLKVQFQFVTGVIYFKDEFSMGPTIGKVNVPFKTRLKYIMAPIIVNSVLHLPLMSVSIQEQKCNCCVNVLHLKKNNNNKKNHQTIPCHCGGTLIF